MADNKRKFLGRMQKKLVLVAVIFTALFVLLTIRIIYIDAKDGKRYEKIVLSQQRYDSVEIPYRRGDILDRNGTQLATSEKVYNLIIEPKNIIGRDKKGEEKEEITIEALKKYFALTDAEISEAMKDSSSLYKKVRKKLTYDEIKPFQDFLETDDGKKVVGVWFETEYQRYYPYNSLACHVLGFTVSGNVGQGGIEGWYSDDLNGINGRQYGFLTSDMTVERTTKAPVNGYNVISTIDANAQNIVEKEIETFMSQTGAKNVSVLVMDPNSGEVIAMANSNKFDLNEPYEDSAIEYQFQDSDELGPKQAQIDKLTEQERIDCLNKTWRNFIISDGFEPGSTYKTFTVAGALESGTISGEETYFCGGNYTVEDKKINCHNHAGHGQVNVEQSLMYSCNVALMQIAQKEGRKTFAKYQDVFGFGKSTHIDLAGEADGLIYDEDGLNPVELATSSFGQGPAVTMMQVGTAFCSVINGGDYYEPHVVRQVVDENGGVIKNIEPTVLRKTISESTSEFMRNALFKVVDSGTAQKAKVEGYTIGGKTGTAEKLPRGNNKYLLSFIGFAPVDNPQVVVYVTVDEPCVEDQANSGLGTIIAQGVFAKLLPYLNVDKASEPGGAGDENVGDETAAPVYENEAPDDEIAGKLTEDNNSETTSSDTSSTENTTQTTEAPASTEATTQAASTQAADTPPQ